MLTPEQWEEIEEWVGEEGALKIDGFDEAIIGVVSRIAFDRVLLYDTNKIIEILMKEMTYEEAVEYYEFNIYGSYVGEKTPMFLDFKLNRD